MGCVRCMLEYMQWLVDLHSTTVTLTWCGAYMFGGYTGCAHRHSANCVKMLLHINSIHETWGFVHNWTVALVSLKFDKALWHRSQELISVTSQHYIGAFAIRQCQAQNPGHTRSRWWTSDVDTRTHQLGQLIPGIKSKQNPDTCRS